MFFFLLGYLPCSSRSLFSSSSAHGFQSNSSRSGSSNHDSICSCSSRLGISAWNSGPILTCLVFCVWRKNSTCKLFETIVHGSFSVIYKCCLFDELCSSRIHGATGFLTTPGQLCSKRLYRYFLTAVQRDVLFLVTTVPGGSVKAAGYSTVLFHCEWDSVWEVECNDESQAPDRPLVLLTGGRCWMELQCRLPADYSNSTKMSKYSVIRWASLFLLVLKISIFQLLILHTCELDKHKRGVRWNPALGGNPDGMGFVSSCTISPSAWVFTSWIGGQ